MISFFDAYDLLVTPGALTPAFDVNLRSAPTIGGQKLDNYMGGWTVTAVITLTACPAMAAAVRFRPVRQAGRLQLAGKPRGEAGAAPGGRCSRGLLGLNRLLPIDPRPGTVPWTRPEPDLTKLASGRWRVPR